MRVSYSPRSCRDFQNIRDFIVAESKDRQAADLYLRRLLDACDSLASLPERFPIYRYAKEWRMMPFDNYLVFFRIHADTVQIGHVRHCARMPFRESGRKESGTSRA